MGSRVSHSEAGRQEKTGMFSENRESQSLGAADLLRPYLGSG